MATKRRATGDGYSFGLVAARAIEAATGVAWEDVEITLTGPPRPSVPFVRCVAWAAQMGSAHALSRINIDAQIDSFNRHEYVERILPAIAANTVDDDLEVERIVAAQIEADAAQEDQEHGSDNN